MSSASPRTATRAKKGEPKIADVLNSIQTRLDSLEKLSEQFSASATLGYKWPGRTGGNYLKEQWIDLNWEELHTEYDDNFHIVKGNPVQRDHKGRVDITGAIRVSVRLMTGEQKYRYVTQEFKDFINQEWARAEKRSIQRAETITERKRVPVGRDDSSDDEWDDHKVVGRGHKRVYHESKS